MTLTLDPLDRTGVLDGQRSSSAFDAAVAQAGRQFAASTSEHQMEVVLDTTPLGGVHRHLTFATPGTGLWRYHLVTYPNHLVVSGDIGTFVFRTTYDMVGFFGRSHGPSPHPSYWAEKVIAGNVLDEFSSEVFFEHVRAHLDQVRDDYSPTDFETISAKVEADLLDCGYDDAYQARYDLDAFAVDLADPARGAATSPVDFRFTETDDWVFTGYNHHYLLACHAVARGTRHYLNNGGQIAKDPAR